MKKDFSQSFERGETRFELILRSGKRYFVSRPADEPHDADFYFVPYVDVAPGDDEYLRIVEFVERNDFSVSELRVLTKKERFSYSFADNTGGSVKATVTLVVDVDVHDSAIFDKTVEKGFVSLEELADKLSNSPYETESLRRALKLLQDE